jgi:hypothetical protein
MNHFILQLKGRNETLYYFGFLCLLLAIVCLILTKTSPTRLNNVSAWFKPFKFAASIWLYAWTMAWYCYYLPQFNLQLFNFSVVFLLGLEIIYIGIQAAKGELSHFNISSALYATLYSCMAIAASAIALYTAYVAYLFFQSDFPQLPSYYVWSIRLSMILFVIFSFEGFLMGSRLSHTIGGADGGPGLPILNWSTKYGDPRIAHFIGMHALQVIPVLSFYVFKNTKATVLLVLCYAALALFTLVQALQGKPLFKSKEKDKEQLSHP